jgi:hypothetical protein
LINLTHRRLRPGDRRRRRHPDSDSPRIFYPRVRPARHETA